MKTINTSGGIHFSVCPDENQLQLYLQRALTTQEQQSIDDHIDQCELCNELLLALAELLAPTSSTPHTPEQRLGQQIDRYQVVKMLGKGGMGAIYEGFDDQLQRPLALKMIRHDAWEGTDRELLKERLIREARGLAAISHPHILPVYEIGEWQDELYIAMQLVQGVDLRNWLVRSQPLWSAIVTIFQQAAKGLSAAHEAGIIHRDIKPDNFLITKDNHVYLADFGLVSHNPTHPSHSPHAPDQERERLTMTGMVVGTQGYIAPELYRGQPADAKADQFAFCVSLYEALYQQMPHVSLPFAAHLEALETGAIRVAHTDDIPIGFYGLLQRGMHPIPSKRFASMAVVLDEMSRLLQQEESSPTIPEQPIHASFSALSLDALPAVPGPRSAFKSTMLILSLLTFLVLGALSVLLLLKPYLQSGDSNKATALLSPSTSPGTQPANKTDAGEVPEPTHLAPESAPHPEQLAPERTQQEAKSPSKATSLVQGKQTQLSRTKARPTHPKRAHRRRVRHRNHRNVAQARRPKVRNITSSKGANRRLAFARRPAPKRQLSRKTKRRIDKKRGRYKIDNIYWWIARLPYKKATICHQIRQKYDQEGAQDALTTSSQQRAATRYTNCLYQASACRKGFRLNQQIMRQKYPRSGLESVLRRTFDQAQAECPLPRFLQEIAPQVIRHMQGIGPHNLQGPLWCRRFVYKILKPRRDGTDRLRRARDQQRWNRLFLEGMRCMYQRAIKYRRGSLRARTCRKMMSYMHKMKTKRHQRGISERKFFQLFPDCQL